MQGASDEAKVLHIFHALQELRMTPKEFISIFLTLNHPDLAYRRRFWTTARGWDSTIGLVKLIANKFSTSADSQRCWEDFVAHEVDWFP